MVDAKLIVVCTLTDDPLLPAGRGGQGGSHPVMLNICRHLIRIGYRLVVLTRRQSLEDEEFIQLGTKCELYRLKIGPIAKIPYQTVSHYTDEAFQNINAILSRYKNLPMTFLSYNWFSGELTRRSRVKYKGRHIHIVLALGVERLKEKEGKNKVSDDWLVFELNTFSDADTVFCGSRYERDLIIKNYKELDSQKIVVLNFGIDVEVFSKRPKSSQDYIRRQAQEFQEGSSEFIASDSGSS